MTGGNASLPIAASSSTAQHGANVSSSQAPKTKKKHRAGRKHKRPRRQSFAAHTEDRSEVGAPASGKPDNRKSGFYMRGRNLSNTSLESEALLDHRDHQYGSRPRRSSTLTTAYPFPPRDGRDSRYEPVQDSHNERDDDGHQRRSWNEGAPLLTSSSPKRDHAEQRSNYGSNDARPKFDRNRRRNSSRSSKTKLTGLTPLILSDRYNVNYPPSMPGTPLTGPAEHMDMSFGDVMLREDLAQDRSRAASMQEHETSPKLPESHMFERRHTIALQAQEDVCFPQEGLSDMADDDQRTRDGHDYQRRRRRRVAKWPDLSVLEEWSRMEKEGRGEERRMKKMTEPQLINGRLRPVHKGWYRTEEDAPYRFTYFNEEFPSTIHSQTISELVQPESSFRELFLPDPPIMSDSSSEDEDGDRPSQGAPSLRNSDGSHKAPTRKPSLANTNAASERDGTLSPSRQMFPNAANGPNVSVLEHAAADGAPRLVKSPRAMSKSPLPPSEKPARYGDRPVWWLDVLSPTEAEMKVIQRTFGIHPLTSEDIMLQEQREKVELFRHYYFVNYRSFDQDSESENHLEPVNMYVVVFREGVISFHFEQTPHPANVRRRIRQLKDFMVLSADWISYAIIDDITDVFVPLIQNIEDEVDDIDDAILRLHTSRSAEPSFSSKFCKKESDKNRAPSVAGETVVESGGDMLQRVGECRKKVMGLYRLLGNKADVIKGFAKRCNEYWDVAPRNEIGLYLGDIQDHIITMTSNLGHYEKILARSHANYLAQINIRMNERTEETADKLNTLTVLGTIVLPMNIVTGLWGMNVWVPGQQFEGNLNWFFAITGGLLIFGCFCFVLARRILNV